MRWTWMSTQMPGLLNPWVTTRLAVLRPTPFSVRSASMLARHLAAEPLDEIPADAEDDARLGAVEADGEDGALDLRAVEPEHRLGRVGEGEEARRRRAGRLVLGAEREQAGDEHLERVARRVRRRRRVAVGRQRGAPASSRGDHRGRCVTTCLGWIRGARGRAGTSFTVQSARLSAPSRPARPGLRAAPRPSVPS